MVILSALIALLLLTAAIAVVSVDHPGAKSRDDRGAGERRRAPGDARSEDSRDDAVAPGAVASYEARAPAARVGASESTASDGGRRPAATGSAGTRVGITSSSIRWGLHAPKTMDGAPLPLSDDPLKGVETYIATLNAAGGINGRKIEYRVADDRLTVSGGRAAANELIHDFKAFHVAGVLGVDQIYQVAAEARKHGVPYMAGGGPESLFKDIAMFQLLSSYDQYLNALADLLASETKKPRPQSIYSGKTKVGVSVIDSAYLLPGVRTFERALKRNGLDLVVVVTVKKPMEQTHYAQEVADLKRAEIVVPIQDPITTARQVAECRVQLCRFVWSFSNFAHDPDQTLDTMGVEPDSSSTWTGVRGLSSWCYYLEHGKTVDECGRLDEARNEWIRAHGERDWVENGQGGMLGYQLVHFWTKALTDAGPNPTRERFVAALRSYDGYDRLTTAPISFVGSDNLVVGANGFVVLEAQRNRKFKQLTPGFVSQF